VPDYQNSQHPDNSEPRENARSRRNGPNEPATSSPGVSLSFAITVAVTVAIIGASVALIFNTFVTTRPIPAPASPEAMRQHQVSQSVSKLTFNPPALGDAPEKIRDAVQHGYNIVNETHKYVPDHVGNKLDCTNCHFNAGMVEDTLSLVGVGAVFPKYHPMRKEVVDLAAMTNMCFERNLNAKPLPADSNDMIAVLAYYQWISKGIPVYAKVPWLGLEPLESEHKPDVQAGSEAFSQCMSCHGQNGQGLPDDGPPLWGNDSFSAASSMAKTEILAAFVHRLMPKGNADLTTTQALDVATFVLSHSRPQVRQVGGGSR
jgi:thiosulfate dehydrogenase